MSCRTESASDPFTDEPEGDEVGPGGDGAEALLEVFEHAGFSFGRARAGGLS